MGHPSQPIAGSPGVKLKSLIGFEGRHKKAWRSWFREAFWPNNLLRRQEERGGQRLRVAFDSHLLAAMSRAPQIYGFVRPALIGSEIGQSERGG
jgi:hypothetical protein